MKKILSVIMPLVTGGVSISLVGLGIHGAEAACTFYYAAIPIRFSTDG